MAENADPLIQAQAQLLEIISNEILETPPDFNTDSDLFEAGLDSMAIMQLLIKIDTHFGIRLRLVDVSRDNFSTVTRIARLLSEARP
jgi:acyl carrier protein